MTKALCVKNGIVTGTQQNLRFVRHLDFMRCAESRLAAIFIDCVVLRRRYTTVRCDVIWRCFIVLWPSVVCETFESRVLGLHLQAFTCILKSSNPEHFRCECMWLFIFVTIKHSLIFRWAQVVRLTSHTVIKVLSHWSRLDSTSARHNNAKLKRGSYKQVSCR